MSRKSSHITVTDMFCGAGGSSQGVRNVSRRIGGGLEVKLAMNHWKLAIETHNTNFPDTLHDCTDISACDPRRYPSTTFGLFSPECTTHSPAGGNTHKALKAQMELFNSGKIDPATERSRATMWDVCRFTEYHRYEVVIVENVVEAKTSWPLFECWLAAMHTLGYYHRCVYLNSMHCHPTPQSRDRMYVVFWKKGNRAPVLDYTPAAFCPKCAKDIAAMQTWKRSDRQYGKYRQQYVYSCSTCATVVEPYYYAAFNCIDWSDRGERIGDRKKPLVKNTHTRIQYGLNKFGAQPLVVHTAYGKEARGVYRSAMQVGFTQTTSPSQAVIQQPLIVRNQTPGYCRPVSQQIGSITTDDTNGILSMPFIYNASQGGSVRSTAHAKATQTSTDCEAVISMPFIYSGSHGGKFKPMWEAKSTQTTQESEALITPPIITECRGDSMARSGMRELNTVTSGGIHSGLLTTEAWNSFISYYYGGSNMASHITEAVRTVGTVDGAALINYKTPAVEDCYYRMLKAPEIQAAMAFDTDYVVLGSSKDKVKQLGNAVTPPAMEWLVGQCVASLK